jgi:hypothetical protein
MRRTIVYHDYRDRQSLSATDNKCVHSLTCLGDIGRQRHGSLAVVDY